MRAGAVLLTPSRHAPEVQAPMPQQPTEEWRPIPSLDGKYSASNLGRIRRDAPGKGARVGRIIRAAADSTRYLSIGWPRHLTVHVLIAEAFHGPRPSPTHQVNHIDGDRQNNVPANLEWVTPRENNLHAGRRGMMSRKGEASGRAKLTANDVRAIRRSELPASALARVYGVAPCTIWNARNTTWKHL